MLAVKRYWVSNLEITEVKNTVQRVDRTESPKYIYRDTVEWISKGQAGKKGIPAFRRRTENSGGNECLQTTRG